jgi:cell division protein FtsQ
MKPAMATALRWGSGMLALVALGGGVWQGYATLMSRPIASVVFTGDTDRVPRAELDRLAAGLVGRQAGTVALGAVRDAVKRIAWVRDCAVRRRFPDGIEVAIESHRPLGRWDDVRLVSVIGEVFAAEYDGPLPRLAGPEGSAAEMAGTWKVVSALVAPLGNPLAELRLSERRAWQAKLASGLTLDLGRGDLEPRLTRFAVAWPSIASEVASATHADLRYANGFALRGTAPVEGKPAARGGRTGVPVPARAAIRQTRVP